jgi:hypothetical protein
MRALTGEPAQRVGDHLSVGWIGDRKVGQAGNPPGRRQWGQVDHDGQRDHGHQDHAQATTEHRTSLVRATAGVAVTPLAVDAPVR